MLHIDILVNIARVALVAQAAEFSLEAWDNTMEIYLRASFLLHRELAIGTGRIIQAGGGSTLNMSSTTGKMTLVEHAAY